MPDEMLCEVLSLVITLKFGATNQTPKPSAEINPNGVSAYLSY